jgi:hypothetical protein
MDPEYLKNLVFSLKFLDSSSQGKGFEPNGDFDDLTPEKLQKSLKSFLKAYARSEGFDKALAVRSFIKHISYSKTRISVDWFYNRFAVADSPVLASDSAAAAPHDKKAARELKKPTSFSPIGPATRTFEFETLKASDCSATVRTITLKFPNIIHNYWDYYQHRNV